MNGKRTSNLAVIALFVILLASAGMGVQGINAGSASTAAIDIRLASAPFLLSSTPPSETVKLIFIHHSCGENWLEDYNGGLGIALRDNNYFVSDTNYGWGPDGIGDNTDIGHWWSWFRGSSSVTYLSRLYTEYDKHSSYSRLSSDPGGENEIIMFKSCYPNSNLMGNPGDPPTIGNNPLRGEDCSSSLHTVANAKGLYNDILEYFETRQDKLFVVITAPPMQDPEYPANARAFNTWLVEEWLADYEHNNVVVFDFYNVLTSNGGNWHTNDLGSATGNHHRYVSGFMEYITDQGSNVAAYPDGGGDDHPSSAGNQKGTGEFVPMLNYFYYRWQGDELEPTPTTTDGPPPATVTATYTSTPVPPTPATPTPTTTPLSGQYTVTFQQSVSPDDPLYSGTTDVILAYDIASNLNLGGTENLETFYGEAENRRSLVRWDLSSLPVDISIVSATLELYRYQGEAEDAMPVALYRVTREWTEGTGFSVEPDPSYVPDGATWQNASPGVPWDTPGGDYDTLTDYGHGPNGIIAQTTLSSEQENGWIRLNATAAARAWIEEGVPNYGVLLRPLSGEYTYHYYCSREYETPNLRPRLIVIYAVDGAATSTPTGQVQPSVTPTSAGTPVVEPWLHLPIILKGYTPISARLIQPTDLEYLGAFRLPEGPEEIGWEYSGAAITYYPDGDPSGPIDGYPGSIFGTGHDWNQYVSEIDIPIPVIALSREVKQLNTARTLQDFHDIRGDLFGDFEIPRVGLEYLPKQDGQATDKLHFCWGQHMQEGESGATHGWCELDLSNPQTRGTWSIGDQMDYVTNDYIFAIPQDWAGANTPGLLLATGRFRDGGQGGRGPAMFAYGPWKEGNPPSPGSRLQTIPLLLYSSADSAENLTLLNYHHSDEWSGGAWLTTHAKSGVIFVGTKGLGECWYGFADGTVWPDEPPYPPIPDPPNDARGWWSDSFVGQMLFYDPADLASVARGDMEPHEPQPYATLGIDQFLFSVKSSQQKHHIGAAGFDRERGHLYVFEPLADGDKSLVHVWRVQ